MGSSEEIISDPKTGLSAYPLDECCYALYLEVPGTKVVMLQGYFETYEGLATVRTLNIRESLVCLLVSKDMLETCLQVLEDINDAIHWKPVKAPDQKTQRAYLGYFLKEEKNAPDNPNL